MAPLQTTDIERLITDKEISVHSTVILSVVDHFSRVAKGTSKRVVGTLLGEFVGGNLLITNAFAVPFEEDPKAETLWFLDHDYHETMFAMFRKINRKERVVGWYSTGPRLRPVDLEIHEVYRRYCPNPVYVIVDVQPKDAAVPTTAYYSIEVPTDGQMFRRTFVHVPSSIGAFEIEEVGVEHLLRDLRNAMTKSLSTEIGDKLGALKSLIKKLQDLASYLRDVADGKLTPNANTLYNLQNIFNLLPDADDQKLIAALGVQTNDSLLAIYLGSLVRAVVALHNLTNNKLENKRKMETSKDKELATAALPATENTESEVKLGGDESN